MREKRSEKGLHESKIPRARRNEEEASAQREVAEKVQAGLPGGCQACLEDEEAGLVRKDGFWEAAALVCVLHSVEKCCRPCSRIA